MATTGFWPIKGRLKDVINYAENPDKTIERKYLDDDLAAALNYVENSDKTDQTMYVSGINCPKKMAYEQMMTTKRRYGKLGGNVAYHGYQSFQAGEVSPEEAHRIGIETAKRMWGDNYEIVVTTHLNTDHLHNHIVVNSVSFRTGRKFENHISDHYKLREISDEVCREHGKTVLENAPFYGGDKAYWVRKSGRILHKDMLRHDVDEALACTIKPFDFELYLRSLGYQFVRTFKYQHPSVIAPDWLKPVRLSSLGKDYTREAILRRLQSQREDKYFVDFYTPKSYYQRQPLIVRIRDFEKRTEPDVITALFELIITIAKLITGNNVQRRDYRPVSRDEAAIMVVDSNLHREHLLPSEKAFAYKLKYDALKRQGKRTDLTSSQVATKFDSATEIGKQANESRDTVFRYIRLTKLIPDILKMVDEQRIAFSVGVELSYLTECEQQDLLEAIELEDKTPSLSQAIQMKKLSQSGKLDSDTISKIISEEKPNQCEKISFQYDVLSKYFPKNFTPQDIYKRLLKLAQDDYRRRQRNREER